MCGNTAESFSYGNYISLIWCLGLYSQNPFLSASFSDDPTKQKFIGANWWIYTPQKRYREYQQGQDLLCGINRGVKATYAWTLNHRAAERTDVD